MNIVIVGETSTSDAGAEPTALIQPDFDDFFARHYAATVRLLSAGGDHAEDAVQEAFTQAYLKWSTIAAYDKPDAWVLRVAVNRMLNERRRLRRRDRHVHRMAERQTTEMAAPTDHLTDAIRLLPARQRMALTLRYLADLDIGEVADVMQISEGAVRYHLHEARTTLRDRLTENENGDDR